MKVIEGAIHNPVTTAVGVILLTLFGVLAVFSIPVQLTPTVEEPQITVQTAWPGASPGEVEREIVDEQEEQLKSLDGLLKMESSSQDSFAQIVLTFAVGSDTDANLLKVSNRLGQVPRYPQDADKPVILSSDPNMTAIAWFILLPREDEPYEGEIWKLYNFVDDQIKPALERVEGVSQSGFFGGREREMQVIVDPSELASRGLTVNQLGAALDRENKSYSGGDFAEGKRRYIVRTVGEYTSPEAIEDVVVAVKNGVPIHVKDVARVELGYRKAVADIFYRGEQMIAINASKEPGANILEVMQGLRSTVDDLNRELLADRGLFLKQVYDETDYVYSAISLVRQSLVLGGVLAIAVLLVFLRSRASTLVVAVAIPISAVGTFLMMKLLGRTLNVVSLAGMAFAVGMVVDNSIVVLENIYRHRQSGEAPARHRRPTREHEGSLGRGAGEHAHHHRGLHPHSSSSRRRQGQLFGDIAIAISCAVFAQPHRLHDRDSLPLRARILSTATPHDEDDGGKRRGSRNLWGLAAARERRFVGPRRRDRATGSRGQHDAGDSRWSSAFTVVADRADRSRPHAEDRVPARREQQLPVRRHAPCLPGLQPRRGRRACSSYLRRSACGHSVASRSPTAEAEPAPSRAAASDGFWFVSQPTRVRRSSECNDRGIRSG